MSWHNVWAVIRREYLQRVRSKWFVFGTIAAPLLMAAVFVGPFYLSSRNDAQAQTVAIADATGVLYDRIDANLRDLGWTAVREPSTSAADLQARVASGGIRSVVLVDERTLERSDATMYARERPPTAARLTIRGAVTRAVLQHNLELSGVDAGAIMEGGDLTVDVFEGGSGSDDPRFLVAYFGAFFLYMVTLIYSVRVMRATLEEKTSRIVEVVISSMEPWHLMLGKILGVGAVGLTQLMVWILSGVALATLGVPALLAARPDMVNVENIMGALPGVGMVTLFVGFFLLGYFMFSGLYAAVGAMCSTDEEAQQAQLPLLPFMIIPILIVMPVIDEPGSAFATGMSLFPLFSPVLMWARVVAGGAPAWQVGLSFALMTASVVGIAWVAGRMYAAGILMTGKRPTLPEIWRWLREA